MTRERAKGGASQRTTAGEYIAVTFLRDGGLGVVPPIQAPGRGGFAWWVFESGDPNCPCHFPEQQR